MLGIFKWDSVFEYRSIVTWALVCFMYFARALTMRYNYEEIKPVELKKGMILSFACSARLAKENKCPFQSLSDESLGSRLSNEEAQIIRDYCVENSAFSSLVIVRKVPFALYLSLSTLLVIIGGSYFEFADIPL